MNDLGNAKWPNTHTHQIRMTAAGAGFGRFVNHN